MCNECWGDLQPLKFSELIEGGEGGVVDIVVVEEQALEVGETLEGGGFDVADVVLGQVPSQSIEWVSHRIIVVGYVQEAQQFLVAEDLGGDRFHVVLLQMSASKRWKNTKEKRKKNQLISQWWRTRSLIQYLHYFQIGVADEGKAPDLRDAVVGQDAVRCKKLITSLS